jgi:hypothetical protein
VRRAGESAASANVSEGKIDKGMGYHDDRRGGVPARFNITVLAVMRRNWKSQDYL